MNKEARSLRELASGSRIVDASDDAAGLAISEQLRASESVYKQDSVNISQGSAILAAADAGLAQISAVLARMMALAAESSSGQVTDQQRADDLDTEYQALSHEINSIASGTEYAGQSLLNYPNALGGFSYQSSSVLLGFYEAQVLRNTQFGAGTNQVSTNVGTLTDNPTLVATYTSGIDGLPTGTSGTFNAGPLEQANSTPFGPAKFFSGANGFQSLSVSIGAFNTVTLGLEQDTVSYSDSAVATVTIPNPAPHSHGTITESAAAYLAANPTQALAGNVDTTVTGSSSNVATEAGALAAIAALGSAINSVSQERAQLGAYESKFNFAGADISLQIQNVQASISTMRDADVAGTKAQLSAQDVISNAAVAALAQASLMPQELLRLIQS